MRMHFILAAALALVATLAHADPVTWEFFETGCQAPPGAAPCPTVDPMTGQGITFPYLLVTLTLPDATSSGTAFWSGRNTEAPTYTGSDFALSLTGEFDGPLTPAFQGAPFGPGHNPGALTGFDLQWDATPGTLTASIFESLITGAVGIDASGLGIPRGTWIGGTPFFSGCLNTVCTMSGDWVEVPIPEPATATLLLLSLALLLIGCGLRQQQRAAV